VKLHGNLINSFQVIGTFAFPGSKVEVQYNQHLLSSRVQHMTISIRFLITVLTELASQLARLLFFSI